MNMVDSVMRAIPPIHREGWPFLAVGFVLTLISGWIFAPLFWIGLVLCIFIAFFFRDPDRVPPIREALVLAPADGRICALGPADPPEGLARNGAAFIRISIFLSVFDCHINRTPLAGRIQDITYRPGAFFNAELDKASERNECNTLIIENADHRIAMVQIAGLVARRIVCHVAKSDQVTCAQRVGLIRFGSRVDVYIPDTCRIMVREGQRMIAGETVLAEFADTAVPGGPKPDTSEPGESKPDGPEPGKPEPGKPEPGKPESGKPESGKSGSDGPQTPQKGSGTQSPDGTASPDAPAPEPHSGPDAP